MSCPPSKPDPCPQTCAPPPPDPPCRSKPVMRGLQVAQAKATLYQALMLSVLAGTLFHFLVSVPRKAAYREFYAKNDFEEWADEMARKGLFQSVPKESLNDFKKD
ncbi:hypothetical protein ACJJTC_017530 [Scirpophaga incertulas]